MKVCIVFLLVSVAIILQSSSAIKCENGWKAYNNACYVEVGGITSYDEAKTLCMLLNSMLVTIHGSDEQRFINSIVKKSKEYYIGLKWEKNGWRWCDGRPLTYQNWVYPQQNPVDGYVAVGGCGPENNRWAVLSSPNDGHQPRSVVCKKMPPNSSKQTTSTTISAQTTTLSPAASSSIATSAGITTTTKTIKVITETTVVNGTRQASTSNSTKDIAAATEKAIKKNNNNNYGRFSECLTSKKGSVTDGKAVAAVTETDTKIAVTSAGMDINRLSDTSAADVHTNKNLKNLSKTNDMTKEELKQHIPIRTITETKIFVVPPFLSNVGEICSRICSTKLFDSCAADNNANDWIFSCFKYENGGEKLNGAKAGKKRMQTSSSNTENGGTNSTTVPSMTTTLSPPCNTAATADDFLFNSYAFLPANRDPVRTPLDNFLNNEYDAYTNAYMNTQNEIITAALSNYNMLSMTSMTGTPSSQYTRYMDYLLPSPTNYAPTICSPNYYSASNIGDYSRCYPIKRSTNIQQRNVNCKRFHPNFEMFY